MKTWLAATAVLTAACRRTVGASRHHRHGDGGPLERRGHRRDRPRHRPADRDQRTGRGRVRLRKATKLAEALAPAGTTITLTLPDGHDDTDDYGRLLRYVDAGGADIGLRQIQKGSQAKYDSTDGYDAHPRQKKYRKQDIKHRDYCANHDLRSYRPVSTNACPRKAPIKGNRSDEWIYHLPHGDQNYKDHQPRGVLRQRGRRQEGRLPSRPGLDAPARAAEVSTGSTSDGSSPSPTASRSSTTGAERPPRTTGEPVPARADGRSPTGSTRRVVAVPAPQQEVSRRVAERPPQPPVSQPSAWLAAGLDSSTACRIPATRAMVSRRAQTPSLNRGQPLPTSTERQPTWHSRNDTACGTGLASLKARRGAARRNATTLEAAPATRRRLSRAGPARRAGTQRSHGKAACQGKDRGNAPGPGRGGRVAGP